MGLEKSYAMSADLVIKSVEDLTEEEFTQQLGTLNPARWILGHLLLCRRMILPLEGVPFDQDPIKDEMAVFNMGGKPDAVSSEYNLAKLLEAFKAEHERFMAAMSSLTDEQLASPAPITQMGLLGDALAFMAWHEAYHTGQLVSIRQALGKASPISF